MTETSPSSDASPYRRLDRVKQMMRNLPFDADAGQLYEEHQSGDDRLRYETKTLSYLKRLLGARTRVFIVLTGNAGHGKTHMCRVLLEEDGQNEDVMKAMSADLMGEVHWDVSGSSLPVRIVKDLSEINPPERAAENLELLLQQDQAHVLVCANEGRLRDVVGRRPAVLDSVLRALEAGLEAGTTSPEDQPDVHVINLNYQAATGQTAGFLGHVLDALLNHQGAWNVCRQCNAYGECPIRKNRDRVADTPSAKGRNKIHRDALLELVKVTEQGGYVLTYREALILASYLITGGLSCADVENLHRRHRREKLASYDLLELLFECRLNDDESEVLRVIRRMERMDPGLVALRPVDERLHAELEDQNALGGDVVGEEVRQLYKRAELRREQESHRTRIRRARRAAWLASEDGTDGLKRTERLGLRHHHRFQAVHTNADVTENLATIRELVRGLHAIQGAVGLDSKSSFHLVDPAFGRSGSHSAVIARSLRVVNLELSSESDWWRSNSADTEPSILESVEWLDRRVVLSERKSKKLLLTLDLLAFEFVISAARGVVMREFHSAERRRILRSLARHAESDRDAAEDIRVLLKRGEGSLTLERDGTILLEKTS